VHGQFTDQRSTLIEYGIKQGMVLGWITTGKPTSKYDYCFSATANRHPMDLGINASGPS
jgi:hypothetical protein